MTPSSLPAPGEFMKPVVPRSLLVARGPGPEFLAATAATCLLVIITRVWTPRDQGAPTAFLEQEEAMANAVIVATALAHAGVLALAARLRSHLLALPALLLGTAALPGVAEGLRPFLHALLRWTMPAMCGEVPDFCPPHAWSAEFGLLLGLCLAPFAVAAVHVQELRAHDDRTRMAWITGALMIVAGGALLLLGAGAYRAVPLTCLVGLAFMVAAAVDTRRRHALFAAWLREGCARVDVHALDDPDDLRPFCAVEAGRAFDGVLRVRELRDDDPYRTTIFWVAVALLPMAPEVTLDALGRRSARQRFWLAVAVAVVLPIIGVSLARM